ncbi:hypothetical protein J4E83_001344 [Alternaria metachromatica]|uniref:uncharacterized protein n=1 Tax=Alternaria metachromatica TaxID=283354 RepID=UPI0020C5B359|nr:uncharacterized protein J4E83_001344 [Alternaria metachromatica]KAI4636389.1 hypothetical protein J4E83_001344 [Alternaria metachromatica]
MADRSLKDLNYGHPGAATYDLENREWTFARPYSARPFKRIRTSKDATPASSHATPAFSLSAEILASRTSVQKEISNSIEEHPQLSAAAEVLPDLAVVSAAISSTASTYDPLVGDLLSFSSITPKGRHEAWQIAALPTGESGSILQLSILDNERHGWTADPKSWVEGRTLKDTESGFWNEEAAPIQQVHFSHSDDSRPFLAVRLPTRTVLFHPDYHRRPRASAVSPFYRLPASSIELHPILSISQNDTDGFAHVDVTFNPDFQLQFALVDLNQTWSIWDIEHRPILGTYSASCLLRGKIDELEEDGNTACEDGWARMLWVADTTTLMVCNRRHLSIVSIKGRTTSYLPCPELFSERSADWILDVKQHPSDRSRVFVLTSTRLFLLSVTAPSELLLRAGEAGAKVLTSWRHYRGVEDFTLHISVQMLSDDVNNLVQIQSFRSNTSDSSGLVTSSDPTLLDLPIGGSAHISNLYIEPMQWEYSEKDCVFLQLFVTLSDLSMRELVVWSRSTSTGHTTENDHAVVDFTRSTIKRPRNPILNSKPRNKDDDFIVPNGLIDRGLPSSKIGRQQPELRRSSDGAAVPETRDNASLGEILSQSKSAAEQVSGTIDAVAVMDQVNEMLATGADLPPLPLGTLMEFTHAQFHVADIDEASSNFQELFSSPNGQDTVDVQRIAAMRVLGLTDDSDLTISDAYDSILQTWVASMPPDMPIRVRQRQEILARRIATELLFSSTCIRDDRIQVPTVSIQRGQSQDSAVALPILPARPKEATFNFTSRYSAFQPLPTPPYSSIPPSSLPPSSVYGSSPPEIPSMEPASSDPLSRLSKYLQTSKDPVIIPPTVSQSLAHWELGKDPHVYNWVSMERTLRAEELDEESQQQREKERKKKERREKRQQRENELMRAKTASQLNAYPRSSPGPTLGGIGSSSQVPSQSQSQSQVPFQTGGFMMPQSQVERGKFGGKLDKKKKKKGRISGF